METAKLTVRLHKQSLEFAERYARTHRMTVDELIDRQLQKLPGARKSEPRESEPWPEDETATARRGVQKESAWHKFFQLGDALATEAPDDSGSLTAAVLRMRR